MTDGVEGSPPGAGGNFKTFSRDQSLVAFSLGLIILAAGLFRPFHPFRPSLAASSEKQTILPSRYYVVEVAGAVENPGIYTFDNPPTVHQAIKRAGPKGLGWTCASPLNNELGVEPDPDCRLDNGMRVEFKPSQDGVSRIIVTPMAPINRLVLGMPVDLNHAGVHDLTIIPGIGQDLAQRIVDFRESHGLFKGLDDLRRVKGIGRKRFAAIRSYLYVARTTE